MKKFTCLILVLSFLFMLNACSKLGNEDTLQQENLEWLNESYSAVITNAVSDDENSLNEGAVLSVGASLDILTSKNMPVGDTLVYKGGEMSYGAALTNYCSYTVDYTFFILINGYLQPFILENSSEQSYSATFTLEPDEKKIIYYTFIPIAAPYGDKALITFAGLLTNKNPVLSNDLLTIMMNSTNMTYDAYLTAEDSSLQITMEENKNIIGNKVEKLDKYEYSSEVILSDTEKVLSDEEIGLMIKTNALNPDNEISVYAERINDESLRAFLWCEGEFIPVFDGGYYADIPDNEYALYKVSIDNSFIKDNIGERCMIVYVDMSIYQSINEENVYGVQVCNSILHIIS